jgi:hypothetical protein
MAETRRKFDHDFREGADAEVGLRLHPVQHLQTQRAGGPIGRPDR